MNAMDKDNHTELARLARNLGKGATRKITLDFGSRVALMVSIYYDPHLPCQCLSTASGLR
jgi:hypothetical protein